MFGGSMKLDSDQFLLCQMIVDLSICANRSNQTHILKMMIECKCIYLWTVYLPERTTCTVYRSQQQSENVSHGITIFGGPACVYIYISIDIKNKKRHRVNLSKEPSMPLFPVSGLSGYIHQENIMHETSHICTCPPARAMAFSWRWSISPGSRYKGGSENPS